MKRWVAILVPLWIALALGSYWEPVVRDGWGHVHWHRTNELGVASVWAFAKGSYLHNNPRLGQVVTLLLYTPGPWHVIVTPLLELAVLLLLGALVLGRWPSLRRRDDARLVLVLAGIAIATCPAVGPMLWYRPYTGNYVVPLVPILLLALPYRFHGEVPRTRGWWLAPALLVLGVAAGLCNEHAGIAVIAALVAACVAFVRRGERLAPWMIAGVLGAIAGYVLLLAAPGHAFRYHGLAAEHSIAGRIAARGLAGNARILGQLALHLAIALPWLALTRPWAPRAKPDGGDGPTASRARAVAMRITLGAAVLATLALYASPLVGDRLYLFSTLLASSAIASHVHAHAPPRAAAALSIVALAVVGALALPRYHALGAPGAARLDALAAAPPGSTLALPRYPVTASFGSVGEDLDDVIRRATVAADYGLAAITLYSSR